MALAEIVVPAASTLTATAAVGSFHYIRQVAQSVDENESRSKSNREVLLGDPDLVERNVIERVRDLEDEIDA